MKTIQRLTLLLLFCFFSSYSFADTDLTKEDLQNIDKIKTARICLYKLFDAATIKKTQEAASEQDAQILQQDYLTKNKLTKKAQSCMKGTPISCHFDCIIPYLNCTSSSANTAERCGSDLKKCKGLCK